MPTPHLPPRGRHPSLTHVTTWVEEENTTNYQRAPRRRIQTFNSEASVQQRVTDYLRLRYPRALWRSDYASGLKLSMAQAAQHKRLQSGRGWPDLQIVEPSADGVYAGLFIELKREGVVVYKKDGTLRSDPHLEEQAVVLALLRDRGFKAEFACGFDEAVRLIDVYLTGRTTQF